MKTTTFTQMIDGNAFRITVPVNRVETILNRVDRLIGKKKFEDAYNVISPFIGADVVEKPAVTATPVAQRALELKNTGRYNAVRVLMQEFSLNYARARYIAIKAGIV